MKTIQAEKILDLLRKQLAGNDFWKKQLSPEVEDAFTLHLAILREPYLSFIMEGKKTVETRFAKRACPPFRRVSDGDVVLLKRTPGEVEGVCVIEKVWFFDLDSSTLKTIRQRFGAAICPEDESFWEERKRASVATLMLIKNVTPVTGISFKKRDRRGWVVIGNDSQPKLPL